MTTVLSIDQGTSGTKAVVVDGSGKILGLAEQTVRPHYLPGSGVEQDPQELLDSVLDTGKAAVAQSGALIDIVTIANQGETVLAWDPATGKPLSNMIVWQDRRAESICAGLADHRDEFASRTGLILDPYFSAPKQAWIRKNVTRDGVVTTSDSWLIHHLTGDFVTDVSTASRSLTTDLDSTEWDHELLDLFELGDEKLPRILPSDAIAGSTSAFGGIMAVGGLIVDQQAALLAENCLETGEAKCTFGTGAFLLANTGTSATRSTAGLAASVAWTVKDKPTYCFDGQVYTAASAVRWLQGMGFIKSASELDVVAAADSGGVLSVPAFFRRPRCPMVEPGSQSLPHGNDAVHRAGTYRARRLAGYRRAGRRAGLPRRFRHRPSAPAAAGRRRADAKPGSDAGRRRSHADRDRRIPLPARYAPGRGSPGQSGT
ncbi:glycerol kinase [Arthrobacter sp. GAS37]